MFREFNVKFEDVEMLGGTDNLLENTEITKVIVRGDNKMSSLDSTFKNCKELDTIDGELDLNGVSDIDNLLEGTELVKSINLKNVNNENISANNSFPHIEEITIGGELYDKKALQNVIASKEWTFDNISYVDVTGENVFTNSVEIINSDSMFISDTLEQKAKGIEIEGQTYENLVVGNGEVTLLDELTIESVDGNKEFTPHIEQEVCVETIEGETYQNLIEGKGEYKLTDTFSTTWTESNNSIDNPPSVIEIPEIWGNTIQDETDLSNIQSLGDLYVDEEGEAILDEDGNEQYRLDILTHGYSCEDKSNFRVIRNNVLYSENISENFTIHYASPSRKTFFYTISKIDFTKASTGTFCTFAQGGSSSIHFDKNEAKLTFKCNGNSYSLGTISHNELFSIAITQTYNNSTKQADIKAYFNGKLIADIPSSDWKFSGNISCGINSIFHTGYSGGCNGITVNYLQFASNNGGAYVGVVEDDWDNINKWNKTTILMPQQLKKFGRLKGFQPSTGDRWYDMYDKLYYDYNSQKFFIKNIPTIEHDILNVLTTMKPITPISTRSYNGEDYYNIGIAFSVMNNKFGVLGTGGIDDLTFMVKTTYPLPLLTGRECGMNWGTSNTTKLEGYAFVYIAQASQGWTFQLSIKASNFGDRTLDKDGLIDFFTTYPTTVIVMKKQEQTGHYASLENIYETVETKILEKHSLETYSPKTYISTNSEIQPSQMGIVNKQTILSPLSLQVNTDYTLQLDSVGKNDKPITVNLGGTETTIQPTNDTKKHHKVVVRTPATLTTETLELSGEGVIVNDVMLFQGGEGVIKQDVGYIDGIESIGELQEDGTYKIDILSTNSLTNISYKMIENAEPINYNQWTAFYFKIKTNATFTINKIMTNCRLLLSNANEGDIGKTDTNSKIFATNVNTGTWTSNGSDYICIAFHGSTISGGKGKEIILDTISKNPFSILSNDENIPKHPERYGSSQSILLPQPLNKIGVVADRFYWNGDKGHYCIEQNVNSDLTILDSSNVIDLPHLNKKYSLDAYMPTTYLECTNTLMQPSKMTLKSDIVKYKPIFLDQNKEYQVKFDCKQKGNSIKLRLGGTEKTITPTLGENTVSITTPQEIVDSRLYLSGANNKLSNVYVIADNMSTSELQEDGTYKIDISTTNQAEQFNLSFIATKPLEEGNKLYWSSINERYEIDRNGEIEVPIVEGDIIDLPRLYQREDTTLVVESGNIKPSKVKVEYLDID